MDILHVFGSTQSDFYHGISEMYAKSVLRPDGFQHRFAAVACDGLWRFGPEPDELGEPVSLAGAIEGIGQPDLVVPHMFCRKGMTAYRAFFEDILGLASVGAPAHVAGLATSKLWTRDVVASAGVVVAEAERIAPGELPRLATPYVVKPDTEDNSLGISVVRDVVEADAAVDHARDHDPVVFAEAFVPGREVRVAVIETLSGLFVPACIEYPVSEARPIREVADKLEKSSLQGSLQQSTREDAQPICPAVLDDASRAALETSAIRAHKALGARDYSLFDFRIHYETGVPHLLEAGLFWSFSDLSAITKMLRGASMTPEHVIGELWQRAAHRRGKQADNPLAAE